MHRREIALPARTARLCCLCLGLLASAGTRTALGVIKVEFPVSRIYAESKIVLAGEVVGVNPASRVLDIRVLETLKGAPVGDAVRIQIANPGELIQSVSKGQYAAIFVGEARGKSVAIVHLADTWLQAEGIPAATPPAWRILQTYSGAKSFSGRTATLLKVLAALQAGKPGLLDTIDAGGFRGGAKELCKLPANATFLLPLPFDAGTEPKDGKRGRVLLVGTAEGVRLFVLTEKGCADATAVFGLAGAKGRYAAVGDVDADGRSDLLLGKDLWLQGDRAFAKAGAALDLPNEAEWLAAALSDVTADKRADVLVLTRTGVLFVLEAPGTPDRPWHKRSCLLQGCETASAAVFSSQWGEDDEPRILVVRADGVLRYSVSIGAAARISPEADFERLTGVPLSSCKGLKGKPLEPVIAVPIDYDGNGKTDLLIVTETGGLTLANRGFGTFMPVDTVHDIFRPGAKPALPFELAPSVCVAAVRNPSARTERENLLVLTEDGRLFEMDNSKE